MCSGMGGRWSLIIWSYLVSSQCVSVENKDLCADTFIHNHCCFGPVYKLLCLDHLLTLLTSFYGPNPLTRWLLSRAQELFLALQLGISLGCLRAPCGMPGMKPRVRCMQDKYSTRCTNHSNPWSVKTFETIELNLMILWMGPKIQNIGQLSCQDGTEAPTRITWTDADLVPIRGHSWPSWQGISLRTRKVGRERAQVQSLCLACARPRLWSLTLHRAFEYW